MELTNELNSAVFEYAMSEMDNAILSKAEFQSVKALYYQSRCTLKKSEATIRTQGVTEAFVVASCIEEGSDTVYSDFSGKKGKGRPIILKDFPTRRASFRAWYGKDQRPYHHKDLYDAINHKLGPIGKFVDGVNHPIGFCAEQHAANRIMLDTDANMSDIHFSIAIRPKTGEHIPYCNNCLTLFPTLKNEEE